MASHPFRVLSEKGASLEEMAHLFAPDVAIHSPFLTRSGIGLEPNMRVILKGLALVGNPRHTGEFTNNLQTVLLWDGTIDGQEIQGVTVLTENADGLISDISGYLRPYQVSTILRDALIPFADALLPKNFRQGASSTADVQSS